VASGPIGATAPEPAPPATPRAAPGPVGEPGLPGEFSGGSGSGAEAARSFTALGLLAGLMAFFLVAQGRFTRGDAKLVEASIENEERVFR
jgi:hypothetical protein